jgi:hypothetical protein
VFNIVIKGGKTKGNVGRALDQPERIKLIFLKREVVKSKKLGIFRY